MRAGRTIAAGGVTQPDAFHVGSREFDPAKVGLATTPGEGTFEFRVRDAATGEPVLGSYNSGHDGEEYGT